MILVFCLQLLPELFGFLLLLLAQLALALEFFSPVCKDFIADLLRPFQVFSRVVREQFFVFLLDLRLQKLMSFLLFFKLLLAPLCRFQVLLFHNAQVPFKRVLLFGQPALNSLFLFFYLAHLELLFFDPDLWVCLLHNFLRSFAEVLHQPWVQLFV